MSGKISASMMCTNFIDVKSDLIALENSGIEMLHFDIMDGSFVPNFTLGPCVLNNIRSKTNIPFDIHLMIDKPEDKIDFFDIREKDYVSVHCESTNHLQRLLVKIRGKGAHPGVALNPATPLDQIENILDDIDFVLIMTVNPGFAGQKFVPHQLNKIKKLREMLDKSGYNDIMIQVDGNVSFENAMKMRQSGANVFVAGTSGIFRKDMDIPAAARKLRESIE